MKIAWVGSCIGRLKYVVFLLIQGIIINKCQSEKHMFSQGALAQTHTAALLCFYSQMINMYVTALGEIDGRVTEDRHAGRAGLGILKEGEK